MKNLIKPYMITTEEYVKEAKENKYAAFGNFLDRFREDATNEVRQLLIEKRPVDDDDMLIQVAKLATAVEILVKEYNLEMPPWVMDEKYILDKPFYGRARLEKYKALLKETAPEEAKRRNIFLGDNFMSRA